MIVDFAGQHAADDGGVRVDLVVGDQTRAGPADHIDGPVAEEELRAVVPSGYQPAPVLAVEGVRA
ncbi:MAG: hypothetical protein NVS1B12_07100 [Acidimicrobiales bacterium]